MTQIKKSLFFLSYQILKGVYTSNLFEACFMVANDDLKGKRTHSTGFNFRTQNLKTLFFITMEPVY